MVIIDWGGILAGFILPFRLLAALFARWRPRYAFRWRPYIARFGGWDKRRIAFWPSFGIGIIWAITAIGALVAFLLSAAGVLAA
jgi:hypothetical protein